jgi:two-component system chemotaxis response regulator CheB
MDNINYVVVIGGSAGGLASLLKMVHTVPVDSGLVFCVVLHSRTGTGEYIVSRLSKVTQIKCTLAKHGAKLEKNRIYIASPNRHMLVKDGHIILANGPEENRNRPSIDVLFRSAAVAKDLFPVGVILSGMLDDGTSGMRAIRKSGGICIVQEPEQAQYPDMPLSVINNMKPDHVVADEVIGSLLMQITKSGMVKKRKIPEDIIKESRIAESVLTGIDVLNELGEKSDFACPDCGGSLWALKSGKELRYRCHIGHAYTEKVLKVSQAESTTATLWIALRMMEERKHLLKKMEMERRKKGYRASLVNEAQKQEELQGHIDKLKEILSDLQSEDL